MGEDRCVDTQGGECLLTQRKNHKSEKISEISGYKLMIKLSYTL